MNIETKEEFQAVMKERELLEEMSKNALMDNFKNYCKDKLKELNKALNDYLEKNGGVVI